MSGDLSGIDYSKYQSWEMFTSATGQVYYKVPGTGYFYDPFLSNIKGRPVLLQDETYKKRDADQAAADQKKAIEDANSPVRQLLPVAGSVGGLLLGKEVMDMFPSALEEIKIKAAEQALAQGAAPVAAQTVEQVAANAAPQVAQQALGLGADASLGGSAIGGGGAGGAFMDGAGFLAPGGAPAGFTGMGPVADPNVYGSMLTANPSGFFQTQGLLGGSELSTAQYLPGVAGAFGAYDVLSHDYGTGRNVAEGALSGAGIGFTLGGPVGAGIGAGVGLLGGFLKGYGDKDMFKTEGNRLQKLKDNGVYIPQGLIESMPEHGRTKEELVALEKSRGGNVAFAESRDEKDLKPQDIIGYSTFAEHDPNWYKRPLQEQLDLAQQALNAGAVREHHGTIDVDFSKIKSAAGTVPSSPTPTPQTTPATVVKSPTGQPVQLQPTRPGQAMPRVAMTSGPVQSPPSVAPPLPTTPAQAFQQGAFGPTGTVFTGIPGGVQRNFNPNVQYLGQGTAHQRLAVPTPENHAAPGSTAAPPPDTIKPQIIPASVTATNGDKRIQTRLTPNQIGKVLATRINARGK